MVFETGRVFGGDSQYYYLGMFAAGSDGAISGDLRIVHYHGERLTAFGTTSDTKASNGSVVRATCFSSNFANVFVIMSLLSWITFTPCTNSGGVPGAP